MKRAASDIRYSDPVVKRTDMAYGPQSEIDLDCIREVIHVHVWADVAGVNVAAHGEALSLGLWGWSAELPGLARVRPGLLYYWRVRRQVSETDRRIRRLKDRAASIHDVMAKVSGAP